MKVSSNRDYLIGYIIIFSVSLLCLFLPFRVEDQPGGTYPTLFGVGSAKVHKEVFSGFEIPAVYIEFILMLIAASLMTFSVKRVFKILSLICLFFVVVFMIFLYVVVTFHFDLFGPTKIVTAGPGYFVFLLMVIFFVAYTIYAFIKTFRSTEVRVKDNDLLDDIMTS